MAQRMRPEDRPERLLGSPAGSRSTADEPIENVIKKLRGFVQLVELEDAPPPAPPPPACAFCGDTGYVVYEWEKGRSKYIDAGAQPCPQCTEPRLRQQKLSMIFGQSGAPEEYDRVTFESYALLPIREKTYTLPDGEEVDGTQVAALEAARRFASADHGSILFYGQQLGVGKTALAHCCSREIVLRTGCSYVFITTIRLLDRIRSTFGQQSPLRSDEVLSAVLNADLLVLDDIGREYKKPGDAGAWVQERLFDIVDWRQTKHLRTIYTSNKTIPELGAVLGEATAWRIKDHCDDPNLIKVQGCNFRDMSHAEREAVLA